MRPGKEPRKETHKITKKDTTEHSGRAVVAAQRSERDLRVHVKITCNIPPKTRRET